MLHKKFILTCLSTCIISSTFAYNDTNLCSSARFSFFYWKSNHLNTTDLSNHRMPSILITEKPSTICTKFRKNYDCIIQNLQLRKSEDINFGRRWKNNPQSNVTFEDSRLAYLPKKLFEAFPQMELLNAEALQIEDIEDRAFSNAANLKYLFLKDNRITAIQGFLGVPLLIHLDVSYNKINFIDANAFQNNKRLQRMLMNNNFISELPNTDTISNLQIVNVANNEISQISDHQFSKNYNLRHLNVSFNNLSYFNLDHLDDKRFLSFIDASHNNLNRLCIPMKVNSLKATNNSINTITVSKCSLEKLDLSRNQITDSKVLEKCRNMKVLDLSHNYLQSFNLSESFSQLSSLNLANNHLFEITFLTNFHPLQLLDLSHNHLSYGPLNKFTWLKSLKLNNNEFIEFKFAYMQKLNLIQMNNNEWDCKKVEDIFKGKDVYVADANDFCRESQSRNGICCKDYKRSFCDRLKELVRETFTYENGNAQDQDKCNSQRQRDIQTIHANTATLDGESKKIYDEIQQTNIKLEETKNQTSLTRSKQLDLSKTHENYKQIVNKLRAHYGVMNEKLISTKTTLDTVLKFTLDRNIESKDRLERKKRQVQERQQRLENLTNQITTAISENNNLMLQLIILNQKEAVARNKKLQQEKYALYL